MEDDREVLLQFKDWKSQPIFPEICLVCGGQCGEDDTAIIRAQPFYQAYRYGAALIPTDYYSVPAHADFRGCAKKLRRSWLIDHYGMFVLISLLGTLGGLGAYLLDTHRPNNWKAFIAFLAPVLVLPFLSRTKTPVRIIDLRGFRLHRFEFLDSGYAERFREANSENIYDPHSEVAKSL